MVRKHTPPDPPTAQHGSDADEPAGVAADDPEHERVADNDNDSEALTRLRARMHQDYARWQQYGPLGRSL